jgi:phosphotransferase system, enzyme I, PtsP
MSTDHIKMLCDIGEFNCLFTESVNIENFLQSTVELVADHMNTEVCSIYLYSESRGTLTLKATVGLRQESVNGVTLNLGEGLVGKSMKELRAIHEKNASSNPDFKPVPGIDEEKYESFLAVPIIRGNLKIGVLVVQRSGKNFFEKNDRLALQATASQLASMIEYINVLITMPDENSAGKEEISDISESTFFKGKSAAAGFAHAYAVVAGREDYGDLLKSAEGIQGLTLDDFREALERTELQLEELQNRVEEKLSDAASLIFSSHLLMLKDRGFIGGIEKLIKGGEGPVDATIWNFNKYKNIFSNSSNHIIKEKINDLEDLERRVLGNLLKSESEVERYGDHIVIARELYPSDLLMMSVEGVKGIILASGGVTSHISILARSLQIPLVIADTARFLKLPKNAMVLIDGEIGNIYINPGAEIVETFNERNRAYQNFMDNRELATRPAETADGTRIKLMTNINLLSDVKIAGPDTVDGIGLYRTEFPFMIRSDFPSEEEQFFIYRKLVEMMEQKVISFRTLDIGGDKILSYYDEMNEQNPFLGMRSIRFSLTHREVFIEQIRAILRAGVDTDIRIMFPMISSVDEFITSREIVMQCIKDLDQEDIPHNSSPGIGMMVELPSVLMVIDELAKEADFFSIGTNDLVQYTLGVDRTNEKVEHLYVQHHPAVLRSIKRVADAAASAGIEVSVCGDMGNNSRYLPFLLGAGIRSFSVDASYIPRVKKTLSELTISQSEKIAEQVLSESRISVIETFLDK